MQNLNSYKLSDRFKSKSSNNLFLDWNEGLYVGNDLKIVIRDSLLNFNVFDSCNYSSAESLSTQIQYKYGLDFDSSIFVTSGADHALELILSCVSKQRNFFQKRLIDYSKVSYINPNLNCLTSDGFDFSYLSEGDFFYFSNPSNPLGTYLNQSSLESLVKEYPNINFIIDQSYLEFSGDKFDYNSFFKNFPNCVFVRTLSKAYQLANFRVGYIICNKESSIFNDLSKIYNPKSISGISCQVAQNVFKNSWIMENFVKEISLEKDRIVQELKKTNTINVINSFCNFILLSVTDNEKLFNYLKENHLHLRNLRDLFDFDFLRLTVTSDSSVNDRLIRLLKDYAKI